MLVLGLDLGTQSLKAVVCDERLVVRGQHVAGYSTLLPAPDQAEQDPRDWEAALGPAIAGALAAAGARAEDIAAIALVGQLDGCIPVTATGAAIQRALIWQDRRASAQAARVPAAEVLARTGQVADASHMAPKIAWLREHGVAAVRFHQPVSYLVERLTGEAVMDPSLASTTMLLDLATSRWSQPMLDAFEISTSDLPALRDPCAIAGTLTTAGAALTGLRVGTRVAVGTGDDFANVFGAGIMTAGTLVCSVGTAEVVGVLSATPVLDRITSEPLVETHVFPQGGYLIEHPGWLAGGAVRWAAGILHLADDTFDQIASTSPPGAGGLTFLPSLAGAMTPVWRPHARGSLHGLALAHGGHDIARAVLEGLVFATRDVAGRLCEMGLAFGDALLVGGGARARHWSQLRADALGIVHRTAANVDASPLGAAMIAAVAAGAHPDLAATARSIAAPTEMFVPDPALRPALDEAYARYRSLGKRLGLSADV